MARGNEAKKLVIEKIKEAFGTDYVATIDGKVYVWAKENGEKIQIAISLTAPKTIVQPEGSVVVVPAKLDFGGDGGWDFEAMDQTTTIPAKTSERMAEEEANIETLMKSLGLV